VGTDLIHYRIPSPERYFGRHSELPADAVVDRLVSLPVHHPYLAVANGLDAVQNNDISSFRSCFLREVSDELAQADFNLLKSIQQVDSYHGIPIDRNTFLFLLQGDWRNGIDIELQIIVRRENDLWKIIEIKAP
jgi:hypothetical protein